MRYSEWTLFQPMCKPVGQGIGQIDPPFHADHLTETITFKFLTSELVRGTETNPVPLTHKGREPLREGIGSDINFH
jgi:hypothetical protein